MERYRIKVDGVHEELSFEQLVEYGQKLIARYASLDSSLGEARVKIGFLVGKMYELLPWGVRGRFIAQIKLSRNTAAKCVKAAAAFATPDGEVDWRKVRTAIEEHNQRFPRRTLNVKPWPEWMNDPTAPDQSVSRAIQMPSVSARTIDTLTASNALDIPDWEDEDRPAQELSDEQEEAYDRQYREENQAGDDDFSDDEDTGSSGGPPVARDCGVEQQVARQAHNLEVAGSTPAPAIAGQENTFRCACDGGPSDPDLSGVTTTGRILGASGNAGADLPPPAGAEVTAAAPAFNPSGAPDPAGLSRTAGYKPAPPQSTERTHRVGALGAAGNQLTLDALYADAWRRVVELHDRAGEEFKRAIVRLAEQFKAVHDGEAA